jgi:hypothetical protein
MAVISQDKMPSLVLQAVNSFGVILLDLRDAILHLLHGFPVLLLKLVLACAEHTASWLTASPRPTGVGILRL